MDWCRGIIGFENLSIGGDKYEWRFGDGSSSNDIRPDHVYAEEGRYDISLVVNDSQSGCESQKTLQVDITPEENDFYDFANVFTPNGDGRNDLFRAVIPDKYRDVVSTRALKVYDRRGQLIYDNEVTDGWDGTSFGHVVPPDVYAFFIEIEIQDCKTVTHQGNVTLVR